MGGSRFLVAMVAVGMLLVGCGEQGGSKPAAPGTSPAASTSTEAAAAEADPVALIGSWTLAEVDDDAGAVLRLAHAGLSAFGLLVFGRCGILFGEWRADASGLFVAATHGNSAPDDARKCGPSGMLTPTWLRRATGFRVEGDSRVLIDDRGLTVARLLPGARPTVGPHLAPSEAEPPVVTDEVRRAFAPAAALPSALIPPSRDALLGRWVPAAEPRGEPNPGYVEFRDDGEWHGSDGCNGQGGRWAAGPAGALLATSGPSTLIGCDNVPVAAWLTSAWRAGLDGQVLVLLDARGKETGRLRRAR